MVSDSPFDVGDCGCRFRLVGAKVLPAVVGLPVLPVFADSFDPAVGSPIRRAVAVVLSLRNDAKIRAAAIEGVSVDVIYSPVWWWVHN